MLCQSYTDRCSRTRQSLVFSRSGQSLATSATHQCSHPSTFILHPSVQLLLQLYLDQFLVFVLVLTRISGLVMTAPVFGPRSVPIQVRGLLAVSLSLIITPLHWGTYVVQPASLLNLLVLVGREAVVGLALGLGIMILFTGLQLAGQIMGQMSGMSLADIFDPSFDSSVPIFAQLMDLVTLAVFVAIGGHRQVMSALLDTFEVMPPGTGGFSPSMVGALVDVTTQSFMLGIRAAAPVMVALLLSVLVMGLISRTLPQLNVIAIGFSLNSMVLLATLSISLGAVAWIFQEQAEISIETLRAAITLTGE
jgi:flagellar biosynthetic protein FliR